MAAKTQGTILRVSSTEAAADTITGITQATSPVVSSTAHGITQNSIVRIASVVGMIQLNNRAFRLASVTANDMTLAGVDSTAYDAYVSGGQVFAQTMLEIGEVTGWQGFDGQANDIDATHLRSVGEEGFVGLPRFGGLTMDVTFNPDDTGQSRIEVLKESQLQIPFSLTLSSGHVCAFIGAVKGFTKQGQLDNVNRGQISIKFRSAPSRFA